MAKRGTRKTTLNKRRKGLLAVIVPAIKRFGMITAAVIFTIWVGAWLWLSGSVHKAGEFTHQKVLSASADAGFTVQNILVEGRVNADADLLLAIIDAQKDDPILKFNPHVVQEQIEKLSWVQSARVERQLPDTIYIRLQERKPLAILSQGKKFKLLDQNGEVISTNKMQNFKDLMIVSGTGAKEEAPFLIGNIAAEAALEGYIKTATRIGERRWDLGLKNGIKVRLPEDDLALSLRRLAEAQENSGLLEKDLMAIDLREHDRITLRTKPGSVQEYKASLKTGNNI